MMGKAVQKGMFGTDEEMIPTERGYQIALFLNQGGGYLEMPDPFLNWPKYGQEEDEE